MSISPGTCPALPTRKMVATSFPSSPVLSPQTSNSSNHGQREQKLRSRAWKPGNSPFRPVAKGCQTCSGKGAVECPGCKGTGKNKKNGNIFERWKCFDCQGFGLKTCPSCGKGGLTPEQRGER